MKIIVLLGILLLLVICGQNYQFPPSQAKWEKCSTFVIREECDKPVRAASTDSSPRVKLPTLSVTVKEAKEQGKEETK